MIKNKSKFLTLVLITNSVLAISYCFNREQPLRFVKQSLESVLLPDEGVVVDEARGCVEVAVRPYRRDFVNRLVKVKFPNTRRSYAKDISASLCKFKVKKISKKSLTKKKIDISNTPELSKTVENTRAVTTSDLVVSSGKKAFLTFDDIALYVECRKFGNQFDVTFSLSGDRGNRLTSSVNLISNQWMNVGDVQQNLNRKNDSKSISKGIEYSKDSGNKSFSYYLMAY